MTVLSPNDLRSGLNALTEAAATVVRSLLSRSSSADEVRADLFDTLPVLVDTYGSAAGALAADWYDEVREERGISGEFVAVPVDPGDQRLESFTYWATQPIVRVVEDDAPEARRSRVTVTDLADPEPRRSSVTVTDDGEDDDSRGSVTVVDDESDDYWSRVESRLTGGVQQRLANIARDTIIDATLDDPAADGWQRFAQPDGCAFCVMLAGRGRVYKTRETASFASHPNCSCQAVPAFGGEPIPVKPYEPSSRNITDRDRARVRAWMRENLPDVRG